MNCKSRIYWYKLATFFIAIGTQMITFRGGFIWSQKKYFANGLMRLIRQMFEQDFSNAKMVCIVENIFEDGQWAILEWRDPLGLRGCGFFQIVNDKILFQRGYWDKLSFLKQHDLPIE
jgi:hypothetical protein